MVIVGAGPSGATCAYYLARGGANVALLEKKRFPRDKYCGDVRACVRCDAMRCAAARVVGAPASADLSVGAAPAQAVCKTAIEILMDMHDDTHGSVYRKLLAENKAHVADSGGLVSPGGLSYIGRSHEQLGEIPAAIAAKRTDLDEAIARAAASAGAHLMEEHSVEQVSFDPAVGLWTVTCENAVQLRGRVLVCADGAPSRLATTLGLVTRPPDGACSRAFVTDSEHRFKADGVVFYNQALLPGYAALFRHPNNVLNYCCYLIPGNPNVRNEDLAKWHQYLIDHDPYVSRVLGDGVEMERMKAGALRLGGEQRTFDDHLLVVGDAAGMIDPMTGEGIHHAMEGGKIAAECLLRARRCGNYSKAVLSAYQEEWMRRFGADFRWSMAICQLLYRFPILIDAATAAVARKGDKFLARWADIMTGRVPKTHLLHPVFVIVIGFELARLLIARAFGAGHQRKAA